MVCHSSVEFSLICALPLIMCMTSALEVLKVYWPALSTPTLAGWLLSARLMDLTAPAKYSFTFSIGSVPSIKKACSID